jgi:hypothetical protein
LGVLECIHLVVTRKDSVLEITQKVMRVQENNSSLNNKHQEHSSDGLLQCENTNDKSYV